MKKEKATIKIDKEIYRQLLVFKISIGAETVTEAIERLLQVKQNMDETLDYIKSIIPK